MLYEERGLKMVGSTIQVNSTKAQNSHFFRVIFIQYQTLEIFFFLLCYLREWIGQNKKIGKDNSALRRCGFSKDPAVGIVWIS